MDAHLALKDAAKLLECSTAAVWRMARQGLLHVRYDQNVPWFREVEVAALAEVRYRHMNIADLAIIARQAHVASRALERQVSQLIELLGVGIVPLELSPAAVLATYLKVEDALAQEYLVLTATEVMGWARLFYAIGEEYLELIQQHTGDNEPWKKLLDLSYRLANEAPQSIADRELETAYGYLAAGRKNLRHVAYFYVRTHHGSRCAGKMFAETLGDINQTIIAMAFPDPENEG